MNLNADKLRAIREVYRLTKQEMADKLNCSDVMIGYIERGERPLSDRIAQRAIEEFALTPEKLARILDIYAEYAV